MRLADPDGAEIPVTRQTKHRASLACLPCRSRHVRCNAAKPSCSRCASEGTPCLYASSRRRGNGRRAGNADITVARIQQQASLGPLNDGSIQPENNLILEKAPPGRRSYELPPASSSMTRLNPHLRSETASIVQLAVDEDLVRLYYNYFHAAHPCALPHWALEQHCTMDPVRFKPIKLVMQYVGSLFDTATDSTLYRQVARSSLPLSHNHGASLTPHEIQAMLLYSIAVFWCDEVTEGIDALGKAIKGAIDLGMHLHHFATDHGQGNSLLEESWRRTWWQIYLTEGNIAGSTRELFKVLSAFNLLEVLFLFLFWVVSLSLLIVNTRYFSDSNSQRAHERITSMRRSGV